MTNNSAGVGFWTYLVLAFATILFASSSTQAASVVSVGNAGNADHDTGYGEFGGVDYNYQIWKYEVTAGEYAAFLNTVASSDPYGLFNTNMDGGTAACGITRNGSSGN